MKKRTGEFLERVTMYVRSKEAKVYVKKELDYHMEKEIKHWTAKGLTELEAEEKVIKEMGSPERLGMKMNELHRPKIDWLMIGLLILISGIGVLPTLNINQELFNDGDYFTKKLIYLFLGAIIVAALMYLDYRKLQRFKWWIYSVTALMITAITFFPNTTINGSAYFRIASLTFDSNTVITALVLCWVILLGEKQLHFWLTPILFGLSVLVLMAIPSVPGVIVYSLTVFTLLWYRLKAKRKVISLGAGGMILLFCGMLTTAKPYQLERLYAFINPEKYSGYIYLHQRELLMDAGWLGNPRGSAVIPEAHTDFAFTTITYYYGWLAGISLILVGILIMSRMIKRAADFKDPFGKLTIVGGVTLFSVQFLYNIGMSLGLLPITSVFLPFVSYGLNPTIQLSLVMGLFLSVYRRKDLVVLQ
ncbi:FtsW/RodA/SpoVE family cell cycle protein [Bacillus salacetis]|uniref:FtsW/RodA/SpoVE family cell cycle protein n=1 Tax=Bacillus salacetis TaxID=2315464 RepID=UPI003BA34861